MHGGREGCGWMTRGGFLRGAVACPLFPALASGGGAEGAVGEAGVGTLPPWEPGHLRIHSLYTGRSEATFLVFPDSTSMLIDCGDYVNPDNIDPFIPDLGRFDGAWIAKYVLRHNPRGRKLDFFMLSHYHCDHAGMLRSAAVKVERGAGGRYSLSGFGQAIDILDVDTIIDRSWPDMEDPSPVRAATDDAMHVREVFAEAARRGSRIEKFRLEKDSTQIRPRHGACPGFSATPLCSNGLVLRRDGTVLDCGTFGRGGRARFGENMFSIGFVLSYGCFRYFTAGDFSGNIVRPDGTRFQIGELLAPECPEVDVAKACHHGAVGDMPQTLIDALNPRVMLGCGIWNRRQMCRQMMRRFAAAPARSMIVPGILVPSRRMEDAAEPWMDRVPKAVYGGCHAVVDVAPGGGRYRLMLVDAPGDADKVLASFDFESLGNGDAGGARA